MLTVFGSILTYSSNNRCWQGLVVNTLCLVNVVAIRRAWLVR